MQKIRVNKEKESTFKSVLRWNDKKKPTVLKATIPAKVVDMLQLTAGNEIVFHIKETELNQYQCDITFKADHLEQIDETASTSDARPSAIDETITKNVETKTDANNEKNALEIEGLPLTIDRYLIQPVKNPYDSIEVRDTKANVRDTFIGIGKRSKENVQELIKELSHCENIEQIHHVLFQYRPRP